MTKSTTSNPATETMKDRHFLTCVLSDEELRAAADELAKLIDDQRAIDDQLATIKSQYKARSEQCAANINAKARLVRDKKEVRPVEVEMTYDWTNCTVQTVRMDTGEIIENRKLRADEAQLQIRFENEAHNEDD